MHDIDEKTQILNALKVAKRGRPRTGATITVGCHESTKDGKAASASAQTQSLAGHTGRDESFNNMG